MNISIVDWFGYNLFPQERMRLIKEAGFSAVILLWADYFDNDYRRFPKYAESAGLYVENAHAPYENANDLWKDTIDGEEAYREIAVCIEECADSGISTLVMHPENKNGTETVLLPQDFSIGIERMKRITDLAERCGVNVAVENMSRPEYLDCIFKSIKSDKLGFCFDSGHCNVFTPKCDLLSMYGERLMALHLHDNNGAEDLHALPFSGNIDWVEISARLSGLSYSGPVSLEVRNAGFENIKNPEEFLRLAAESAGKIAAMTV